MTKHKHKRSRRHCSPLNFARPFQFHTAKTHTFINLGFQSGNEGISHTIFFCRMPSKTDLLVSEPIQITGLCSYRYVYACGSTVIQGLVIISPRSKTRVSPYKLVVSNYELLPDSFNPFFDMEKLGILYYTTPDGSTLLLSTHLESRLLVRVS